MDIIRPPSPNSRRGAFVACCAFGAVVTLWLSIVGTLGYVAYHFISKWW